MAEEERCLLAEATRAADILQHYAYTNYTDYISNVCFNTRTHIEHLHLERFGVHVLTTK